MTEQDQFALSLYTDLVKSGEFYEFMGRHLPGMTRDEIKKRFLSDVIAKRKANKRGDEYPSRIEDVFRVLFAIVWRYVRQVNQDGFQHANLIRELQRAESGLVIGQVCEGLRLRSPKMFVMTLHDAIYSTDENMPAIRAEFERVFNANGYRMSLSD